MNGHFGQFKIFSKKANRFGWNVLRSTMFQIFLEKSIKYQLKKWISKKVFIFIFKKYWNLILPKKWGEILNILGDFCFLLPRF